VILELDIGNSRIKWRQKSLQQGDSSTEGIYQDLEEFFAAASRQKKPKVFRFCSVREQSVTDILIQWSRDHWGLEPQVAEVSRVCGGVTVNYPDISRLGVDRWLAMLAGFNTANGACLIVDCGTAFTLDSISPEGVHLGGFILPGLNLMQQSLTANTGIRLSSPTKPASIDLGNSTDEAVLNGSLASLVAIIEKQVTQLSRLSGDARLYFTGGDAAMLEQLTEYERSGIIPGLVLDGLAIACPSPEKSPAVNTII